jgi:hypothetical protein
MKLALAAACLVASITIASQALADGRTVVTLQQPVAKPTDFVATRGVWHCEGTTCVSSYTPDETFGTSQCHAVAREVGVPISDFRNDNGALQPAALDKCNTGLPGGKAQTASR